MPETALYFLNWVGTSGVHAAMSALLLFGLVSYAISRTQVKYNYWMEGIPSKESEDYYNRLPVAWPMIFVLWPVATFVLIWLYSLFQTPWSDMLRQEVVLDSAKQLFLIYLVGFASMWGVYLLSQCNSLFLVSRTLRRLLMTYSSDWPHHNDGAERYAVGETKASEGAISGEKAVIEARQKKANSSITWIALLIAAAAVMLGLINDVALERGANMTAWEATMLAAAATTAIIAFYCFVVSADALETVFNNFTLVKPDVQMQIIKRLYEYTLNPKYYGLISLISSVALFAAARYPLFGALALATATFIGYGHWFPRLRPRQGLARLEWVLRIGIVVVPILFLRWS